MAEVLAQEHDKCLPLVFDDAFAYSDPQRVRTLQDMLGLAAERGLQIIILTCNPSDYTNLGAKQISLLPARPPGQAPQPQPAVSPNGDLEEASGAESLDAPVRDGVTPEQRLEFLDALRASGGHSGNTALRTTLGWEARTSTSLEPRWCPKALWRPGAARADRCRLCRGKSQPIKYPRPGTLRAPTAVLFRLAASYPGAAPALWTSNSNAQGAWTACNVRPRPS